MGQGSVADPLEAGERLDTDGIMGLRDVRKQAGGDDGGRHHPIRYLGTMGEQVFCQQTAELGPGLNEIRSEFDGAVIAFDGRCGLAGAIQRVRENYFYFIK